MKNSEYKSDCEVCKRLTKEKYKHVWIWKIGCAVFTILSAVFAVLYFLK